MVAPLALAAVALAGRVVLAAPAVFALTLGLLLRVRARRLARAVALAGAAAGERAAAVALLAAVFECQG